MVIKTRNSYGSVSIFETSHHFGEDLHRIGHDSTKASGVEIETGALYLDLQIAKSPQPVGDGRDARSELGTVRYGNDIGL